MVSAVLCTSALLSDAQFSKHDVQEQPPAAAPDSTEPGLSGSNSLTRYLAQQGQQQQHSLKAEAVESFFAVTNLEFDRETGLIRAVSSQSEDCSLLVSFADEDHPANIYKTEIPVRTGEYTESSGTADLALLPEFFTVRAQLVNRIGLPVGQPFILERFTREMQEILAAEVTDFEPEQVVNLDADETTNFIVLSEDTVRADSTAVSNTLVSADYDQNIYVFDNIDESIRSLEQGQYFFIQPTETDIISTDIKDIVIEGDTATITGSGDVGEMFDFIKMEIEETKTVEISADERSYLGVNAQTINDENTLEQREESILALDDDAVIHDFALKQTFKTDLKSESGRFQMTPSVSAEVNVKWNHYRKFGFTNVMLVCDFSFSFDAHAKLSTAKDERFDPLENIGLPKEDADWIRSKSHTIQVPIATIGGAALSFFIDPAISLDGEMDFSIEKKFTKGFVYDSDHGFEAIDFDSQPVTKKLEFSGSAQIEVMAGVEVSALKGLVKASIAGGVSVTITADKDNLFYSNPLPGANVFIADTDTDSASIHACEKCMKLTATIKVSIAAKLAVGFDVKDKCKLLRKLDKVAQVGKLKLELTYSDEIDSIGGRKIPVIDIYTSYNSDGDNKGLHFNFIPRTDDKDTECPMKANKTTFHVSFVGAPADTEAELRINNTSIPLPVRADGKTVLYCVPRNGKYGYSILINGERQLDGNFSGPDSAISLYHTFTWQKRADGTNEIICESGAPIAGPAPTVTTAAATAVTAETTTETKPLEDYFSPDIFPAKYMITPFSQYCDLGENIAGMFSNDGTFNVIGHGDMYADASVPENIRAEIRTVIFEDEDPDSGLFINDIASGLFRNAKNLETVYMPHRIRQIGSYAFCGCESLKYLRYGGEDDQTETFVLPETLETIGDYAFSECGAAAFGELTVPQSVLSVGAQAFGGCNGITALTVPGNGQTAIGMSAFGNCTNLRTAVFGSGVKKIDAYTFGGSNHVEALTVPFFSVTETDSMPRGISAFFSSSAVDGMYMVFSSWHVNGYVPETLTDVTVTGGTELPEGFFEGMTTLRTVSLPAEIAVIGNRAFKGCENLADFTLPQKLTEIGYAAFSGCRAIPFGELTIPETVGSIGSEAFSGCTGITALTIPGSGTTSIGMAAFGSCTALRKAELGSGVQTVSPFVFTDCGQIEELTLPSYQTAETDLQPPGISAFFTLSPNTGMYQVYSSFRVSGYVPETLKKVTILSGDTIPGGFFSNMNTLVSVKVPRETKTVMANAFNGCEALAEAHLTGSRGNSWDSVDIVETGNEPLLRLVRKQRPDGYKPGDANGDGKIDVSDAVLIARFAVGDSGAKIKDIGVLNADVNGDGSADLDDITLILQFIAKRIREFPVDAA